jgi:hypothetical protein
MTLSTLFQELQVQVLQEGRVPGGGRTQNTWAPNGISVLGALSTARAVEQTLYGQDVHDEIYTLSVPDTRYAGAKPDDRLWDPRLDRYFYVRAIDDDSSNQQWCTYFLSLRPGGK